jgi:hypothetical protein
MKIFEGRSSIEIQTNTKLIIEWIYNELKTFTSNIKDYRVQQHINREVLYNNMKYLLVSSVDILQILPGIGIHTIILAVVS